jgi:hypothetical protein
MQEGADAMLCTPDENLDWFFGVCLTIFWYRHLLAGYCKYKTLCIFQFLIPNSVHRVIDNDENEALHNCGSLHILYIFSIEQFCCVFGHFFYDSSPPKNLKQGKILIFLHSCKLAIERSDIGIITPDISFLFVLIAEVIKWSCIFKGGAVQSFLFFYLHFFQFESSSFCSTYN